MALMHGRERSFERLLSEAASRRKWGPLPIVGGAGGLAGMNDGQTGKPSGKSGGDNARKPTAHLAHSGSRMIMLFAPRKFSNFRCP